MRTRLRIEFARPDDSGDRVEMYFALRRTPVVDRFIGLVEAGNQAAHGFRTSWSMGAGEPPVAEHTDALNLLIEEFNASNLGAARIDTGVTVGNVTRRELNEIHEQFEIHLKASQAGRDDQVAGLDSVMAALNAINLAVHRLESDLDRAAQADQVFSYLTSTIEREGWVDKEPLDDRDYDEFTMQERFGILYANYATTGKNLQHIFWSDDFELLEKGGATPQRVISSGVLAMFNSPRKSHREEYGRFARWFEENDIQRYGYKLEDKRNSLGMIKLGSIIPTADNERFYSKVRRRFDPKAFVNAYVAHSRVTAMTIEG